MLYLFYIAMIFFTAYTLGRNPELQSEVVSDQGDPALIFVLSVFWPIMWFYRCVKYVARMGGEVD
jgi:hypothetical protein